MVCLGQEAELLGYSCVCLQTGGSPHTGHSFHEEFGSAINSSSVGRHPLPHDRVCLPRAYGVAECRAPHAGGEVWVGLLSRRCGLGPPDTCSSYPCHSALALQGDSCCLSHWGNIFAALAAPAMPGLMAGLKQVSAVLTQAITGALLPRRAASCSSMSRSELSTYFYVFRFTGAACMCVFVLRDWGSLQSPRLGVAALAFMPPPKPC